MCDEAAQDRPHNPARTVAPAAVDVAMDDDRGADKVSDQGATLTERSGVPSTPKTNHGARSDSVALATLFGQLYPGEPDEDGLKASRNERLSKGYKNVALTYGETSAAGFLQILLRIRDVYGGLPAAGAVFYDLGCGTGVPVFAAATVHKWQRCVGVEILRDLYAICQRALERWECGLEDISTAEGTKTPAAAITFVCGDFTALDWSDGDVIFANSTCFDDGLMKKLARGAEALKEGAILVTTTDPIPSEAFEILDETVMMQAGRSATTCYIQRRLAKILKSLDSS